MIKPDPADSSTQTPLLIANTLVDHRVELKSLMSTFDDTWFIQGEEILAAAPAFVNAPQYFPIGSGKTSYRVGNIALVNTGTTYLCVVEKVGAEQSLSSWHVVNGLNSNNYPCAGTASKVNALSSDLLQVDNLVAGKTYVGFVSATNSI